MVKSQTNAAEKGLQLSSGSLIAPQTPPLCFQKGNILKTFSLMRSPEQGKGTVHTQHSFSGLAAVH